MVGQEAAGTPQVQALHCGHHAPCGHHGRRVGDELHICGREGRKVAVSRGGVLPRVPAAWAGQSLSTEGMAGKREASAEGTSHLSF